MLIHTQLRREKSLFGALPPQQVVLCCGLPCQVHHLEWWLTKHCVHHLDRFCIYPEMSNVECSEMQLTFRDIPYPLVFLTTPKVSWTGLNPTTANNVVVPWIFQALNKQYQTFALVVWLGQNRIPHTWLLNTGTGGYDNHGSNPNQHSQSAQLRVRDGLLRWQNIMTLVVKWNLELGENYIKQL